MDRQLHFVIHHLNPWGGHDRSTLEVVRRLSRKWPVRIHTYSLEDPNLKDWGPHELKTVHPHFRKPALLLLGWFHTVTWLRFIFRVRRKNLIHATGSCSLLSDVIQVQFVQAAWQEAQKTLSSAIYQSPRSRSANFLKKIVLSIYQNFLLLYNSLTERWAYSPKKRYIAIADCVARDLEKFFSIPAGQIDVVRHGVDCSLFRPGKEPDIRKKLGFKENDNVIIFVGEYERKGLAVAIEALAQNPGVHLLAVGNGDVRGFEKLAQNFKVADRVHLISHQKEIEKYYRAADIFLLPTYYEPFGLVILEAMATGLPTIVSRCAGGAELIREGENGLLIQNPRSAKEISEILKKVLGDSELRQRLGAAARRTAENRTWNHVAEEYARALDR